MRQSKAKLPSVPFGEVEQVAGAKRGMSAPAGWGGRARSAQHLAEHLPLRLWHAGFWPGRALRSRWLWWIDAWSASLL